MPSPLNVPITPPRVAFIDPRTGTVSREWYMFFLSLFQLSGGSTVSLDDLQKGPPSLTIDDADGENLSPLADGTAGQIAELTKQVVAFEGQSQLGDLIGQLAELQKQVEGLQMQPVPDIGALTTLNPLSSAPVTKTADFTVANETWLINNKSGSSCVVTLPDANTNIGRVLHFLNYQAQNVVSASTNVVPLAGGAASASIVEGVAGANVTLISDGINWVIAQHDSNNSLELE